MRFVVVALLGLTFGCAGSVSEKLKSCNAPPPGPPCACQDLESDACGVAFDRFDAQLDGAQAACINDGECADIVGCVTDENVSAEEQDCLFACGLALFQCADENTCGVVEVTGCLDENASCRSGC